MIMNKGENMFNGTDEEKKVLMKKLVEDGILPDTKTYIFKMRQLYGGLDNKKEDIKDFFDHTVVVPADLGC